MGRKLQFFVAGLGRFGESVAVTLEKMGYDVNGHGYCRRCSAGFI